MLPISRHRSENRLTRTPRTTWPDLWESQTNSGGCSFKAWRVESSKRLNTKGKARKRRSSTKLAVAKTRERPFDVSVCAKGLFSHRYTKSPQIVAAVVRNSRKG